MITKVNIILWSIGDLAEPLSVSIEKSAMSGLNIVSEYDLQMNKREIGFGREPNFGPSIVLVCSWMEVLCDGREWCDWVIAD